MSGASPRHSRRWCRAGRAVGSGWIGGLPSVPHYDPVERPLRFEHHRYLGDKRTPGLLRRRHALAEADAPASRSCWPPARFLCLPGTRWRRAATAATASGGGSGRPPPAERQTGNRQPATGSGHLLRRRADSSSVEPRRLTPGEHQPTAPASCRGDPPGEHQQTRQHRAEATSQVSIRPTAPASCRGRPARRGRVRPNVTR